MTHHAVQGDGDAIIIPFPLHRVSPVESEDESALPAVVNELPGPSATEPEDREGEVAASPKLERRAHNVFAPCVGWERHVPGGSNCEVTSA